MRSSTSSLPVSMMIGVSDRARISRAKFQPAFAGQHEIEQDDVECAGSQRVAHACAVRHRRQAIAFVLEIAREHLSDPRVVVDDENMLLLTGRPVILSWLSLESACYKLLHNCTFHNRQIVRV